MDCMKQLLKGSYSANKFQNKISNPSFINDSHYFTHGGTGTTSMKRTKIHLKINTLTRMKINDYEQIFLLNLHIY